MKLEREARRRYIQRKPRERTAPTSARAPAAGRSRLTLARRYTSTSRVEKRGPPPSTSTTAKLRKQKMKISAPAASRAGASWGRVTRKNSPAPCAPRLRAASSVEGGSRLHSAATMRAAIGKL